jgi:UDP-N-acetylmuramoyl-tripeptide--D-alanyl-D-alanine ligase
MKFSLEEICEWTGGGIQGNIGTDIQIASVSSDTRTLEPGALYVAIKGEVFDGHQFVPQAVSAGAVACVVEKIQPEISVPQILVPDTLQALRDMAIAYRDKMEIPVVAITGSNGKTTTKNFTVSVLQKKFKVAFTKGNFNNHIGLPLSILSIKPDDEIAVFEVGTNHPGEIASLAAMCKPSGAVITNIGIAHIEFFGSKEAIAKEKGALPASLPETGFFVVPAHDEFVDLLSSMTKAKVIRVESSDPVNVHIAEEMSKLRAMPSHIITDATLAATVGRQYEISEADILDALLHTKNEDGRFALKQIGDFGVIDDSYNANPDSVCAAIEAMGKLYPDRRKILALGKLMEQGAFLEEGYNRIIAASKKANFEKVIFVDIDFGGAEVAHAKNQKECAEIIKNMHQMSDIVLVKGSKSAEMWRLFDFLQS